MSTCRVLVIRFSSIGDIVLTTPVLRALKTQLEGEVSVHFLTKSKFKEVVAANPHIDVVHTIENSVQEILPDLEQADFDYIIDLQNNLRSRIVRRRLKVLSFALRKLNIRKWILVRLGIDILPDQHIVDRYMECLSAFDVSDDGLGLDFFIRQGITSWPVPMKQPYIAMAIGAAHEGKKFSRARLEQLCQLIPYPIALLGGTDDIETGNVLAAISPDRIFNGCGRWTLEESADVLKHSELVICGDTGLMHMACALRKKIIMIWGCTSSRLGMGPYLPAEGSIEIEPQKRGWLPWRKRPCSKLGNRCKFRMRRKCIDTVDIALIAKAIERLWAPKTAP